MMLDKILAGKQEIVKVANGPRFSDSTGIGRFNSREVTGKMIQI